MFLKPMTLEEIADLPIPSERVPLSEHSSYENAIQLIQNDAFENFELGADGLLNLQLFWNDTRHAVKCSVHVKEQKNRGVLSFSCSHCTVQGRKALSCDHQWASYLLIWQALVAEKEELIQPALGRLSEKLREFKAREIEEFDGHPKEADFSGVILDSVSLFLDEPSILQQESLAALLPQDLSLFQKHEVKPEEELLSPRLWNLPEIFRKKNKTYSDRGFHEAAKQNRLSEMIRYNFSNGMQISAREILRHPLHKKVKGDLLPQAKTETSVFAKWPLVQQGGPHFVSRDLLELEEIIQALLNHLAQAQNRKQVTLYLQNPARPQQALKIESLEFDVVQEVEWRVDFAEKKELESEFKLTTFRRQKLYFFESFAVEPVSGVIVVHPWLHELSVLREKMAEISPELSIASRDNPRIDVIGEIETKALLRHLRTRQIPIHITGESRTLRSEESLMEIRMQESGEFYLQHEARVMGQKNLQRRGWTSKSTVFLQTLSKGLPFLLNVEAREVASRTGSKRDWDLKLLKHLGILQYLMFETLSFHFTGALTDSSVVSRDQIFQTLHGKIRDLLIAGTGATFIQDQTLSELCSKSALTCFENFVETVLKTIHSSDAFYSEQGEIILEGVVEREFRLLYELLMKSALSSGGTSFQRARTGFLSRISRTSNEDDPSLRQALFHFPKSDSEPLPSLQLALDSLQNLIPHGFKIYYNDQILQELGEDEFHVDFILQADTEQKLFNWFELNPKFFLRGEEVDPDQFLRLGGGGVVEYGGKLYLVPQKQMPSLRRLENFWRKLQKGKVESSRKKTGEKVFQLPRNQTLELLALRASGVAIRGDHQWKKLCDFYDHLGTRDRALTPPPSTKGELKAYQESGVLWLQDLDNLRLGALLADDMGLGKTLQTLCFLDDLRSKDELGQVLVVVPSSLVYNWISEIEKFTPELPVVVFSNRDREKVARRIGSAEPLVVITTYGLMMEHENFINQYKWRVLIFDEAQNLKNITTKRTSAARSLTAQFKICLTGTPMENHFGEFYSLVDLLVPGSLGRLDDFRRKFVNTEMVSREEMEDLKLKIKPLLLRRTKKEIMDQLPEKQETKVSIAFEDQQKEIYRDIALSYNKRVHETMSSEGEAKVQLQMLTALLRLRQACSDPSALPNVRYDKVPPKLETLLESLSEIVESGESALVFTQFLQTLEHTTSILKKANIPVFVLHGGVPTKQRQNILAEFNAQPGGAVLLMTLKTGGVGLNLTKASYVFHLEPWWNPSVENQATDRAHRLGQNKAVQVFRYIMHESLEEKIELLKDRKDRKFQALMTQTERDPEIEAGGSSISKQDFDMLIGLD